MSPQSESPTLIIGQTCHVATCESPATSACDRCGKLYCDTHLQTVSLKRRADPSDSSRRSWDLTRMPSIVETYRLCAQCSNKPFSGKLSSDGMQ